jgi:hypothetical protein
MYVHRHHPAPASTLAAQAGRHRRIADGRAGCAQCRRQRARRVIVAADSRKIITGCTAHGVEAC